MNLALIVAAGTLPQTIEIVVLSSAIPIHTALFKEYVL